MDSEKRMRGSVGQCVYCGEEAPIKPDHVPPRNLFPTPKPSNLITVPSCESCNSGASKDDEYFKNMIVMRADVWNDADATRLLDEVMESLRRPEQRKFIESIVNSMTRVGVTTPAGLYLGERGGLNVNLVRINRVMNRTIRGLFYHERKERLPTKCNVCSVADAQLPNPDIMTLLASQPPKIIGNSVFSYRSLFAEDERYASGWLLIFYEAVPFVSLTVPVIRSS